MRLMCRAGTAVLFAGLWLVRLWATFPQRRSTFRRSLAASLIWRRSFPLPWRTAVG